MTDLEIVIERLTAWVRDFGDQREPAFIGDISLVLLAARERIRETTRLADVFAASIAQGSWNANLRPDVVATKAYAIAEAMVAEKRRREQEE